MRKRAPGFAGGSDVAGNITHKSGLGVILFGFGGLPKYLFFFCSQAADAERVDLLQDVVEFILEIMFGIRLFFPSLSLELGP